MRVVFHRAYPSGFRPAGMVGVNSQPIPQRFPDAFQFWFLRASAKTRSFHPASLYTGRLRIVSTSFLVFALTRKNQK